MKITDLHRNQLKKQIVKLEDGKFEIGEKNVIFRSDSKGRAFLQLLNHRRINLIYRSGAKLDDNFMKGYTLNRIKRTYKPTVILFFGTCEIVDKRGKYLYIPHNINARIEEIIIKYTEYKQTILLYNPEATVIFLDCPYLSLIIWNFLRKHPSPGSFEADQKILEQGILVLNRKLKDINGPRPVPRLSLDFMYSIKKRNKPIKRLRNYGLLYDGVHAGSLLVNLWYQRIIRMIAIN